MMRHLDNSLLCRIVRGSFLETAPRETAENTVKHHDGGVGLMVANHRRGGESSVVVATLSVAGVNERLVLLFYDGNDCV